MKLSVIIPTYDRFKFLEQLLYSLPKQNLNFDVVVVEQEKSHRLPIIKLCEKLRLDCKYVFMNIRSTSSAINKGVEISKGDIIYLVDDDCILKSNALRAHLTNYTQKNIGGVCGRVVTPSQAPDSPNSIVGRISRWSTFTDGYSSKVRQYIDSPIGCNFSFRRSIYDKVGGIDESFTQNAIRFEADLALRFKNKGFRIVFDPAAEVVHLRAKSGGTRMDADRSDWYFHFFSNETYFFLKHKNKLFFLLFFISKLGWIFRCISRVRVSGNPRYFILPFEGVYDGFKKYILILPKLKKA